MPKRASLIIVSCALAIYALLFAISRPHAPELRNLRPDDHADIGVAATWQQAFDPAFYVPEHTHVHVIQKLPVGYGYIDEVKILDGRSEGRSGWVFDACVK